MKKLFIILVASVLMHGSINMFGQEYQHRLTEQEKKLMPAYLEKLREKASVSAPSGSIRSVAEFEPSQGVLIAYPLGISHAVIAEMAKNVVVTTIVSSSAQANTVKREYQSKGINVANCNFLVAAHNSYWTRDYGPMFIAGDTKINSVDFTYNRPRVDDNKIPMAVSNFLGNTNYKMDLVHAGGNYMTDGQGIAVSTNLIWEENSSKTHAQINQQMLSYLGVASYLVTEDPLGDYIKHVDCWGKFLDVDKILIGKVPTSNSKYSKYEAIAYYFANQTSSWGNKYQVYRVYEPNGEPYTNSLILNKKVLVPQTGSAYDDDAIAAYQAAMPGYEIIGFTGAWESTDALHCRAHEIADLGMLNIKHIPLLGEIPQQNSYLIEAQIKAYSGQSIYSDSVRLYYKVNFGNFISTKMTKGSGNTYSAPIPQQVSGSVVSYYIHAADNSGRSENHPYIGQFDPHVFTIKFGGDETLAPTVTTTVANAITTNSANIDGNITSNGGATITEAGICYSTSANPTTANNKVTTSTTLGIFTCSLTGLTANVTYHVRAYAKNSVGTSYGADVSFTTLEGLTYCTANGNNISYEWIAKVEFGTFANTTTGATGGYGNYITQKVDVVPGASYTIGLTPGFASSSYSEYWKVYVDFNNNGVFTDAGENIYSGNGMAKVSGSYTVPVTIAPGEHRMRVIMKYNAAPTSPCGSFNYGEVEDYTMNVTSIAQSPSIAKTTPKIGIAKSGKAGFIVWPNPSNGIIKIGYTEALSYHVVIIDQIGRILLNRKVEGAENQFDLSNFGSGAYFIKIIDGTKESTKKIFIER